MSVSSADAVEEFLTLKDHNTQIQKAADKLIAQNKERMAAIESAFQTSLTKLGMNSINTDAGGVRKDPKLVFKADEWSDFYAWMSEDEERVEHFLQKRLSNKALEDYVRDQGHVPPGLKAQQLDNVVISKNTAQQNKTNKRRAQVASSPTAAKPTATPAKPDDEFDI